MPEPLAVDRDVAAMEELLVRLAQAVASPTDLARPDVLRLSRRIDRVAARLQRRGCVRTAAGWLLPSPRDPGTAEAGTLGGQNMNKNRPAR